MDEQELINLKRRYKRRMVEYRQIIKRLKSIVMFLLVSVLMLMLFIVVPRIRDGAGEELSEEEFTGEKRIEMRHIEATYKVEERTLWYSADFPVVYGEGMEKVAESIEEEFSNLDIKKRLEDMDASFYWGEHIRLDVTRLDDSVVSINENVRVSFETMGMSVQEGYTFSVKTGKRLELDDLLKDSKGFYNVIDSLIMEYIPFYYPEILLKHPAYEDRYKSNYTDMERYPNWHLNEKGIAFSFEEGQFLAEYIGIMEVTVPYDDVAEYLKEEYLYTEE